ncbi:MAG: ATP-dependent helicase [Candidatus Gastranaerophilales bacterium]|nr:ATP-dependent helicase [Candidatus Gastranaerophilales bacterium]
MALELKKEISPNEKQLECINNIEGKYLVLAGPGTGKTYTIVQRIKNMINKGIKPDKILCLTFTDTACSEMKKRIEHELNVSSLDSAIYTYHSFCANILDEFQEDFELAQNYKIMNDTISKAFIKECIDEINPKYFRTEKNDPYYYINTIKNRISLIKQNRLNKEKFYNNIEQNPDWKPDIANWEQIIDDTINKRNKRRIIPYEEKEKAVKKVEQAYELWQFYELYQEKLNNAKYLDFNDMINLVLDKFEKSPSFLDNVANRYEYILVDEYQDTNKSQNEIVFSLTRALKSENVFVVGDDNQIIYRFQGAKLDTIENFIKTFPDTKVICLRENMRSTQNILDVSRKVIEQDPLNLENNKEFSKKYNISKVLEAKNKTLFEKNKPVRLYKYTDIEQEYYEIVKEIEEIINSEECPKDENGEKLLSEIAILVRSNSEAEAFFELLKAKNIPAELKEGRNIFEIPAVNVLYFYIQFLINPLMHSYRIFQLLTMQPFKINPHDWEILYNETSKGKTFIDVLRNIPDNLLTENSKLKQFLKTYNYLSEYKSRENIKNTILEIGAKTGIFDYYLNNDINKSENILGIKTFVDEAQGFSEIYKTSFLEEFYTYLKAIKEDEETITTQKAPVSMNAIQLCTYHGSKGREFEYVYMPTLIAQKWESNTKSLKAEIPLDINEYKTSDEIREIIKPSDLTKLLYVAMTRAKHTLRLSYPDTINKKIKKPTKFLSSIQDVFEINNNSFEYSENSYIEQIKADLFKKEYDYIKEFKALIQTKLSDRAYSATAVNKYLSCPRRYFLEEILELCAKDGNPNFLSYGSAIHKACENAAKYVAKQNDYPSKEEFINWFKDELNKLPMENYEQRINFATRGEKALEKYYSQILNTPKNCFFESEYKLSVKTDDFKFIGYIDRIDKNSDGTYILYDYKTGNNKNYAIKPEGDHEDYYNQMALYKYFYELQTKNKVSKMQFIYPEDFSSKNDGITYTQEEIQAVLEKFKNAVENIKNAQFEPNCNEKSCKNCPYSDFCNMQ